VDGNGVYMQRYDADGAAEGTETRLNALTAGTVSGPSVSALSDGGFVVSWGSAEVDGVVSRRFDAAGVASEDESLVNTYTTSFQGASVTSRLADGGWVIGWTSNGQDGDGGGIYMQRYHADGTKDGGETPVNTHTASNQQSVTMAGLANGGWVVGWTSTGQDGDGDGIYLQRYDAQGQTAGKEILVNDTTTGNQRFPSFAALADGGWVAAWQGPASDGGFSIYQKVYDATGHVIVDETEVRAFNDTAVYNREVVSVAGLADGGWIVSWSNYNESSDEYDVRQQRYEADGQFYGANDAPVGHDKTLTVDENYSYVFNAGDFGFQDTASEQDHFAAIIVTAGPKSGRLMLDGAAVHAGDRIARADLDDLVWTPPKHADGDALASFKFKVVDDGGTAAGGHDTAKTANTITFNVTAAIEGTDAGETLKGTNRHDVLDGKAGDDTLIGRGGADIFVFGRNDDRDTITDFDAKGKDHDIVDLSSLSSIADFADLKAHHISEHGSDVWINGRNGDVLVLQGVEIDDLDKSCFLF